MKRREEQMEAMTTVPRRLVTHDRIVSSLLTLVFVVLALMVLNIFYTAHVASQQAEQRCSSIEAVSRIPVPTPVAGNPSRQWEASYEAIQRGRAKALGCK